MFGGLVANELVSIQPMSLPSGLLFYLDYTYGSDVGGDANLQTGVSTSGATYKSGQSNLAALLQTLHSSREMRFRALDAARG